ncbi:hypothetical protein Micbo1qcDRAFT_158901, partial [Microdochium bolleyi]
MSNAQNDANLDSDQPGAHRRSFAESLLSTDSVPNVMSAQSAKAYHVEQIPIVVRPPSRPGLGDVSLPQTSANGDRSSHHDKKNAPQVESAQSIPHNRPNHEPVERPKSRRDQVRARKARDMEAMKNQCQQVSSVSADQRELKERVGSLPVQAPQHTPAAVPEPPTTQKMVPEAATVSDDLPPPEVPPLHPARTLRKTLKRPKPSQSNTSTDVSKPGSPVNWDRASSQRRKERHAERKAYSSRRERYLAEARAEQKDLADRLSRQELVLRYENLKELRTYDMEKRLRRLERNGEVWLRSMVPLMENLNRLLQEQYSYQRNMQFPPYSPGPISRRQHQYVPSHPMPQNSRKDAPGSRQPHARLPGDVDRAEPGTNNYSLRSVRSHDSP